MAETKRITDRRPLARMNAEKYRPRTVKMPDSLWTRFAVQAVAEGELSVSTFVRCLAFIELERRERERAFGTYSGRPGMPGVLPAVRTGG